MLRDRTTGTNIHRQEGRWNQSITQWESTQQPFTSSGILDSIKASNEVFETLAQEWSSEYEASRQPLFDWIERAKKDLH
jgi:hypothetical protein